MELAAPSEVRPARRGRPRSETATTAALDAAYRLAAEEGLAGASMDAIAAASGVSKMTIYKWWDGRLPLLVDAFLLRATLDLPLPESADPVGAFTDHARRYVEALRGDMGRVLRAVLAECMAKTGDGALIYERYLSHRRELGLRVIEAGQSNGAIRSRQPAAALWDGIYGPIFYRFVFNLPGLDADFAAALVATSFAEQRDPV